jgi:N-dimethylarginine dimethylaminohydrolase
VIMPEGVSEHTQDQLRLAGVQVITVPYDKMIAGGGGLHCSTAPLVRDEV